MLNRFPLTGYLSSTIESTLTNIRDNLLHKVEKYKDNKKGFVLTPKHFVNLYLRYGTGTPDQQDCLRTTRLLFGEKFEQSVAEYIEAESWPMIMIIGHYRTYGVAVTSFRLIDEVHQSTDNLYTAFVRRTYLKIIIRWEKDNPDLVYYIVPDHFLKIYFDHLRRTVTGDPIKIFETDGTKYEVNSLNLCLSTARRIFGKNFTMILMQYIVLIGWDRLVEMYK